MNSDVMWSVSSIEMNNKNYHTVGTIPILYIEQINHKRSSGLLDTFITEIKF